MTAAYSIAIETSSRAGGLALGRGEELLRAVPFEAAGRHATQLLQRLDELLRGRGLRPADLAEVYVSAGPGSFTGLRIGITVARTLALALPGLRVAPVPTASAVAENARDLDWQHLAVVMDHKDGEFYAALFCRGKTGTVPAFGGYSPGFPALARVEEFLSRAPRPLVVLGEALEFVRLEGPGVTRADPSLDLPTPEGVWRVGRRLAKSGEFTEPQRLLPLYTRKPEAVRLWEKRNPGGK
jgi:tRNA threonylcarbamoyladenosine biosynthesis protein TsaB